MIHKLYWWCGVAAVALALASTAAAAATDPTEVDTLEAQLLSHPEDAGVAYRLAGAYRASGELRRGVDFLTLFHQDHEPNSQSLVWLGSLKTQLSASGNDLEERLDWLQAGVADMDRAVRLFADNPQVKLVRGVTISNFPTFLKMYGKAIRDLNEVLESDAGLSPEAETAVRQALARAYRQAGQEEQAQGALAPAGGGR